MKLWFKYDIAFSVAEEDRPIAQQIAAALKEKRVRYYYYEERIAESWGEYLINLTKAAFGKRTRYVLMITSKMFIQKYWSSIERQMAFTRSIPGKPHILQLRLDNTEVEGLSQHQVYLDWNNNPEEISDILVQKIRKQQQATTHQLGKYSIGTLTVLMAVMLAYVVLTQKRDKGGTHGPAQEMQRVLDAGPFFSTSDNKNKVQVFYRNSSNSFYISNTEVTVAQYRKFCDAQKKELPPQAPLFSENSPVVNISWDEAVAYCKWLEGRLPTDAEWEYAAGGGLSSTYSGGNNAGKVAVYDRQKPKAVASKAANAFGIYDMTGNVAEWCNDWYDSSFTLKSVRGGAYNSKINPVNELAITYRSKEQPGARSPYIGFRVVWDKK